MTRVMQRHMKESTIAVAAVALLLAGTVHSFAQESVAVRAVMTKDPLPVDDPNAAAWSSAPQAQFPMSPQVHWQNRIQEVTVKDLKVRALNDGKQVAVLLEYADPTEDPADAAALEFMVGDKKAHFAHGQPMAQVEGGPVNIWFWRNKDGKGPASRGFNPPPANFSDPTTIAMLQESYLFWRIKKGGVGLPIEGMPWKSAMPRWEVELPDEWIWKIILGEYDGAHQSPRTWE